MPGGRWPAGGSLRRRPGRGAVTVHRVAPEATTRALDGKEGEPDRVVVQELSSLERDLLREALHIVKDFKQRLSHRYHLEYG